MDSQQQTARRGDMDYTDYLLWKFVALVVLAFFWNLFRPGFSARRSPPAQSAKVVEQMSDSPETAARLMDQR